MSSPFLSVIIPTFSRPRQLDACLCKLAEQTYPRDQFQVIVVDDGGTYSLDALVKSYKQTLDISLIRQQNSGPAVARNQGAAAARGVLLVFTDDDCLPDARWLEAFAKRHCQAPLAFLGGAVVNYFVENSWAVTSQLILDSAYSFYNRDPDDAQFFASNNIALPAGGFRDVGGFSPAFRTASEDRELCDRWRWQGHHLVSVPEAVVEHAKELQLGSFVRQHLNYGRGAFQHHRERARRGSVRFSREIFRYPVFYLTLLKSLTRLPFRRAIQVSALLVLAQAVNAMGFLFEIVAGRRHST
jgi:glycosyltransferase involved in cell wall biosynthesis